MRLPWRGFVRLSPNKNCMALIYTVGSSAKCVRHTCTHTVMFRKPSGQRSVRANGLVKGFRCTSNPEDERFFAALRMTGGRSSSLICSGHTCAHTVLLWLPPSKPSVRANGPVKASAARLFEKTGDSSTPLRMTCFAITIGENCRSSVGTNCHPEEALSAVPGTGRRQADEGSTAALNHPRAICTCQYLRGSTAASCVERQ